MDTPAKEGITLSPKMSFVVGLVGGMLVLCTIGFFILLTVVLSGKVVPQDNSKADEAYQDAINAQQPTAEAPAPEEQVGEVAPVADADHVRGSASAEITLIEYSDFECPFCSRFHATMLQVMDAYEGQVKWVFRNFPLSFHANALPAANAAECAGEQGKFWEFADGLFENQEQLSEDYFTQLAAELKLNKTKFASCYSAKKYQSKIDADRSSGSAAGVSGTPGTIILAPDGSKQLIPGALPFESVKAMIDPLLQ